MGFFPFQNNPKNLDPFYEMDLDFWGFLKRESEMDLVFWNYFGKGKKLSYNKRNMFLYVYLQVQTDGQQIGENQVLFNIQEADNINHVVVFMTGQTPFPDGLGGAGDGLKGWEKGAGVGKVLTRVTSRILGHLDKRNALIYDKSTNTHVQCTCKCQPEFKMLWTAYFLSAECRMAV